MDDRRDGNNGWLSHRHVELLVGAGLIVLTLMAALAPAANAKRTYCTRHHHPHGCVKVPPAAKRPHGVSQQGSAALTPSDVENGGGMGGGPGNHRAAALQWARAQVGDARWRWRCERFVEEAFGTRSRFDTARAASKAITLHRGPITEAPAGSLVFFAADRYNQGWGHVGLSLGRGRMLSALSTVTTTDVPKDHYWRGLYLGWADAPADWPGRIPPPPGPTTPAAELSVRITAPAPESPQSGVVPLLASASGVGGVEFQAYYATDPLNASTRDWHVLGAARRDGDSWTLDWDTTTVPNQGLPTWGTVNVAAIALDGAGQRTGTRDYRRVTISNSGSHVETPPPASTAYPETTGGAANTWSDPASAGGTPGQGIAAYQTVQIACRLTGYRVPDGNTWWYRIAESPWNGRFYVTADAFYNNGSTSGPLANTPFYDPVVPTCS